MVVAQYGGVLPASPTTGPPLTEWTREAASLATIADLLKALQVTIIAVNSEKGKGVPKPEPESRPITAYAKIQLEVRLSRHYDLARRIVPDRS